MASSSTAAKKEFLVILPDYDGVLEQRMKVRSTHFENMKPRVGEFLLLGGAIMDEHPKEGEALPLKGSVMLVLADSKEAVLEEVKKDVYYQSKVWDADKVQILPFRSAFRTAM